MKLKITCILAITLALFNIISTNAQRNLINPQYFSFENNRNGWYITDNKEFKVSKMKASDGKSSIKFFSSSQISKRRKTNLICNSPLLESKLKSGTYKIVIDVWVPLIHPKSFYISLAEKGTKLWIQSQFSLNNLKKSGWQTIEATIKVKKKVNNPRIFIYVPVIKNSRDDLGTFYIDNFRLFKVKK